MDRLSWTPVKYKAEVPSMLKIIVISISINTTANFEPMGYTITIACILEAWAMKEV